MEPTKWRYDRDHITDLTQLDEKLVQWGNRGWELATVIHAKETNRSMIGIPPSLFRCA